MSIFMVFSVWPDPGHGVGSVFVIFQHEAVMASVKVDVLQKPGLTDEEFFRNWRCRVRRGA